LCIHASVSFSFIQLKKEDILGECSSHVRQTVEFQAFSSCFIVIDSVIQIILSMRFFFLLKKGIYSKKESNIKLIHLSLFLIVPLIMQ